MTKSEIRHHFKKIRSSLSKQQVAQNSQKICRNFIENLLPKLLAKKPDAKFSLYLSSYNEVLTDDIAQYFSDNNIEFSYPKIIAKNTALKFIKFEGQKFTKNEIYPSIIEPENGEEILPDFMIIPLVAFDKNLNRLGMGGGFFDRTLSHFKTINHKTIAIGFGYQAQRYSQELPTQQYDQSLDFVVCEDCVLS